MDGLNIECIIYNMLHIAVIICFALEMIAAHTEHILYSKHMNSPLILQGEVIELCRAAIGGYRMSRFSGFHYAIVEYEHEHESLTYQAKIMRSKEDFVSRKINLAVNAEGIRVVVRQEQEKAYKFPHYLIWSVLMLYLVFYDSSTDFIPYRAAWIFIVAFLIVLIYIYRDNIVKYFYVHREIEWQKKSVIDSDGNVPKEIVIAVFIVCTLCVVLLMFYLSRAY